MTDIPGKPASAAAALPRWGALATVWWSLVVMAVFFATQIGFYIAFLSMTMGHLPPTVLGQEMVKLQTHGDVLAVATLISTPACVLAMFAIVKLKRGSSLFDTLALDVPPLAVLGRWLLIGIALAVVLDSVTWLIGKPIVPEFMQAAYRSAEGKPTLWFALVVAAPLFEELLFRGFVITGLSNSRIGPLGAVIVASLAWSAIHVQYDVYGIAMIVVLGLLLGAARVRTGSVLVPMAMHAMLNLIATLEAMIQVG